MTKRLPFMMDDFRDTEDEAQLDALRCATAESNDGLDELGMQLLAMREELVQEPDAQTRWNHLAAMRHAVPTARPRRTARGVAAVAAATIGVLTLTAGLAAANQLPQAAQDRAARLAEIVGVDIPGNDHQSDRSHSTPSTTAPGLTTANRGKVTSPGSSGADAGTVSPADPGAAPGQSGSAPGHSGSAPGQSGTAPGNSGTAPGQTGTTPGQSGSTPGQSGSAPDQTGTTPGKSGGAPGQSGTTPGSSGNAPGHNNKTTTDSVPPPGKSGDAPGHNK